MPRKIKELIRDYIQAGFKIIKGGKGSHRKLRHPSGVTAIVSGKESSDAKYYQEDELKRKIRKAKARGQE